MNNLALHLGQNTDVSLIFPMAAMFFLSLAVLVFSTVTRVKAVRARRIKVAYFSTYSTAETDDAVLKTGRHFSNLFEAPVLFYTVCLAAMVVGMHSFALTLTAWLYFGSRVLHAYIHMGENKLYPRMFAYLVSWIFLSALWIQLLAHVTLR